MKRFSVFGCAGLCLLLLSAPGCGGAGAVADAEDVIVEDEALELDLLIRTADRAIEGELDYFSFGLSLQENAGNLQEEYPGKEAIVAELNQIGAALQNGGGKELAERAKAKLEELK